MAALGGFQRSKVQPVLLVQHPTKHFMPINARDYDILPLAYHAKALASLPKSHALPSFAGPAPAFLVLQVRIVIGCY